MSNKSSPVQVAGYTLTGVHSPTFVSNSWTQISIGTDHALGIKSDGKLFAWGRNFYGQLGDASLLDKSSPVQIGTSSWSSVTASKSFSMGITTAGILFGWGDNSFGQLGEDRQPISNQWKSFAMGNYHTLALRHDDTLWVWGYNSNGQLGINQSGGRSRPVQLGNNTWNSVYAGTNLSAAIRSDGTLWMWGENVGYQLGDGTTISKSSPVQITAATSWSTISITGVNTSYAIAIDSTNKLWAWGTQTYGTFGDGTTAIRTTPGLLNATDSWVSVATGNFNSARINSQGKLFVTGANGSGELGLNDVAYRSSPVQVGGYSWNSVSMGLNCTFGIRGDYTLWSWGYNATGQLGLGDTIYRSSPTQVGTSSWTFVRANGLAIVAQDVSGRTFVWGNNSIGSLGDGTTVDKSSPVQLTSGSWTTISVGNAITGSIQVGPVFAKDNLGNWYGWSTQNNWGNFGIGTSESINRSEPTQIGLDYYQISPEQISSSSWTQVNAGLSHVLAIRSDRTLWSWGTNNLGQLGLPEDPFGTTRSSPVQVSTSSFSLISAGNNISAAIDINNKLYTWGSSNNGQLGQAPVTTIFSWKAISGNTDHTLAIRNDDKLYVWGRNTQGQLGLGDTINRSSPTLVGNSSWISIGTGLSHSVAVDSNNRLFVWGYNGFGQLGDSTTISKSSPVQTGVGIPFTSAAAGAQNTFGLWNGYVYGFGQNSDGQLGDGTTVGKSSPVLIISSVAKIVPLSITTGFLKTDGSVWTTGNNTNGQLGVNSTVSTWTPAQASTYFQTMTDLFGSPVGNNFFAIDSNKMLWAWGLNTSGQLGDSTIVTKSSPTQVSAFSWTSIATTPLNNTLGVQSDGTLWSWGAKTATMGPMFNAANFPYSWSQISVGLSHTAGIRSDRRLFTWGLNTFGQLGDLTTTNKSSPVMVTAGLPTDPGGTFWKSVAVTAYQTYGITTSGKLYAWGQNDRGQLLLSDRTNKSSPSLVTGMSWSSVSAGYNHAIAINSDGTLWAWGDNTNGQLGVSDYVYRSSPVQIGSGSWTAVNASAFHSFAIDTNNKLFAWGNNDFGQLGLPITTSWTNILALDTSGIYLAEDGRLFGMGHNGFGELGVNDNINRSSPIQVGTNTGLYNKSWIQISGGSSTTFGILTDKTLWGWGSNGSQVIDGTIDSYKSSPVQISGSWNMVSSQDTNTLAIKTDGTLWAWGANDDGELGIGDRSTALSPTQVGSENSWVFVETIGTNYGYQTTIAAKLDGTLWGWGLNNSGQVGDGTLVSRSSPVQVLTNFNYNNIKSVSAKGYLIDNNDYVWRWGNSGDGGQGPSYGTAALLFPVNIGKWADVQVNPRGPSFLGIDFDGYLWAWGGNTYGELGLGDNLFRSSPVQVGTKKYKKIYPQPGAATYVLAQDNTVWAFGYNDGAAYEVAYNASSPLASRSSPVQIGTYSNVISPTQVTSLSFTSISTNRMSTFAIAADGALYAWGNNKNYQLGLATPSSFRLLPSSGGASVVNTSGKLFQWGMNTQYQLGDGTTISKSNPTAVYGADLSVSAMAKVVNTVYKQYMMVVNGGLSSGLWAWGENQFGKLGVGDATTRSGPVQISPNSWKAIATGGSHSLAIGTDDTLWGWGAGIPAGRMSWKSISAGVSHGMILRSDGLLYGMGNNTSGAVGVSTTAANRSSPVQVGSMAYAEIAAGNSITLAIDTYGSLVAWGNNNIRQLGTNGYAYSTFKSSPSVVDSVNKWSKIAVYNHLAAITTTGKLFVWGDNTYGQIGDGTTDIKSSPTQIGTSSWSMVSVGPSHTVALTVDGKLFAWGDNTYGFLGDGTTISKSSPIQIGTSSWTFLQAGGTGQTAAITTDGKLFTWGSNFTGESGRASTTIYFSSPIQVGTSSYVSVSTGSNFTIAKTIDNTYIGFGQNTYGQMGSIITENPATWIALYPNAAVRSNGTIWSWGGNNQGQLGTNSTASRSSPVQVSTGDWLQYEISGDENTTFYIKNDYTLWATGYNISGQLGDGTTTAKSNPVQIPGSWASISAGYSHTVALRTDGTVWAWGKNTQGQLGDNSVIFKSSPVQVGTDSDWNAVVAGSNHTLMKKTNGTLWAFGAGNVGQLGHGGSGTSGNRSNPIQVGTDSDWNLIEAISDNNAVIKTNGTMWTWGSGAVGATGFNSVSHQLTPAQLGTSSWTMVTGIAPNAANGAFFALSITGALFAWGINSNGYLGLNDVVYRSSPVQIGASSWATVVAGKSAAVFGITGGKLYSWGTNTYGQLAQNDITIMKSSPVQVGTNYDETMYSPTLLPALSGYSMVTAGSQFAYGIDSTKFNLSTWGKNQFGQLGDSSTVNRSSPSQIQTAVLSESRSSPVQIDSGNWTGIAAGLASSYAIKQDGSLWVWGIDGGLGVLGLGDTVTRSSMVQLGTGSWSSVAATYSTVAAITSDNRLFLWGFNTYGQLGDGSTITRSSPVQVGSGTNWSSVSLGDLHTVALKTTGELFTWGLGTSGQLGDGTTLSQSSPIQIGTSSWTSISAGTNNTLGLINNTLWAWGYNGTGELGDKTVISKSSPVQVSVTAIDWSIESLSSPTQIGTSSFTTISAGHIGGAGVKGDGSLWVWGNNFYGEAGNSTNTPSISPVQIGASSWTTVASGYGNNLAIKGDAGSATLWAWGYNNTGQLGESSTTNRSSPVQVTSSLPTSPLVPTYVTASAGYSLSTISAGSAVMALSTDSRLYTWGGGSYGQLGTGTLNTVLSFTLVGNNTQSYLATIRAIDGDNWSSVSAGSSHMLGINSSGTLFGWGNYAGTITPLKKWTQITGGINHMIALRSDGTVWAWGRNQVGQLGLGDTFNRSVPTQVSISNVVDVESNTFNSAVICNDGSLWVWGRNVEGQVGDGTTIYRSSPVQIGTSSWSMVSIGTSNISAITTDGKLFAWGSNLYGSQGDGTTIGKSSPVQVMSDKTFAYTASGYLSLFGITSDYKLYAVGGYGANGELGLNDLTSRSSPVQIGTERWKMLTASSSSSSGMLAIKYDGTLWAWGNNTVGQLGDGTIVNKISPVLVSSSIWTDVDISESSVQAVKADGTVWVWGSNTNGRLGDGTGASKSSPVQLTSINANQIGGGSLVVGGYLNSFGEMFTTGTSSYGEMGDGSVGVAIQYKSNPIQIASFGTSSPVVIMTGQWSSVSAGTNTSLARKTNGALFAWGDNTFNKIGIDGIGLNSYLSSPVQIGSGVNVVDSNNTSGIISNE